MNIQKLPIIGYARRYWHILLLAYLSYLFARSETVWNVIDVFAYMPLGFFIVAATALFFRNVFHAKTTDSDVDNGNYRCWYNNELSTREKCLLISFQWLVYCLIGAILALGLLIILAGHPAATPS